MSQEEYYAVPIIPYEEEDELEHNEHGFCADMSHECHEDTFNIAELGQAVEDGKATPEEADLIYRCRTL